MDVRTSAGGTTFSVRVQPGARREGVVGAYGDAVKIALAAPAVDGRANDALLRFLADLLQIPRLSVEIVSGHTSRTKVIRVLSLTSVEVEDKLTRIEAA